MVDSSEFYFVEKLYSNIPYGWDDFFEEKRVRNTLLQVEKCILSSTGKIAPLPEDVFSAFYCTPPFRVKAVFFGQDPYHTTTSSGLPVAVGLSFATRESEPIPASLRVIFSEIQDEYIQIGKDFTIPECGDLKYLTKEGVLLLNKALTVKCGLPGSHCTGIWDGFIKFVLEYLQTLNPKIIYILLGEKAKQLKDKFLKASSIIVEGGHPSPLNCRPGPNSFRGCGIFNKANDILLSQGETPIEWLPLPESE